MIDIAVIGAGFSGITIARQLSDFARITVFEKSRGVGGRMSTRRTDPFCFDHGAQFFRAKTDEFKSLTKELLSAGVIQRWEARHVEIKEEAIINQSVWGQTPSYYVGVPHMNTPVKFLARGLDIRLNTRVQKLQNKGKWELFDPDDHSLGMYDWVISTAPAPQTLDLLPSTFKYVKHLSSTKMSACFSLMLGFNEARSLDFDAATLHGADVRWIAVDSSKPGRGCQFCLVVHASHPWSEEHLNDNHKDILRHLCRETSRIVGFNVETAEHQNLHRWRYAQAEQVDTNDVFVDKDMRLAACGDWCIHGRVEAAFISGLKTAYSLQTALGKKSTD